MSGRGAQNFFVVGVVQLLRVVRRVKLKNISYQYM